MVHTLLCSKIYIHDGINFNDSLFLLHCTLSIGHHCIAEAHAQQVVERKREITRERKLEKKQTVRRQLEDSKADMMKEIKNMQAIREFRGSFQYLFAFCFS